ncbi:MAG: hypothetical protein JWO78_568, partial [Micavibrio sp.]|nr:hypothetical protein [Micavibrio sp.]
IREALKLTKGNPTKARQQVIAWAVEDQRLLLGLTQPHLTGVVAHAINRVIYREGTEQEAEEIMPTPKSLDMGPETFGKQILNALAGRNTPIFGMEGTTPSSHPTKASQSHIDAMNKLAKNSKKQGDL